MTIRKLSLVNFRNYSQREFHFSPQINLIIGSNASGKTNLLEAIYLLAAGESFRAQKNEALIHWSQNYALVEAEIETNQLKIVLIKKDGQVRKEFWLNQVKKTRREFLTAFLAVVFRPEEIRVVTGSPARRRDFLDKVLAPLDWRYRRALLTYEKALRRRNKLLLAINQGEANQAELFYWHQALAKNGEIVRQLREDFFTFVNQFLRQSQFSHLSYRYLANPITLALLDQRLKEDLAQATTSCGPHRDDFVFLDQRIPAQEKDLALWGSRAQQRLAILALKLAQLAFVREKRREKPVLLLDDIFSELDHQGRDLVASLLEHYQIFLTATKKPAFFSQEKNINLIKTTSVKDI